MSAAHGRAGRIGAGAAVVLLVLSLAAAGCTNTSQWGFDIWNYSANHYVVKLTFVDGTSQIAAVPPNSMYWRHGLSDPQQAVVYDQTCSRKVVTLAITGHWAYVVIDSTGAISADPSARPDSFASLSSASSEPLPSACPVN